MCINVQLSMLIEMVFKSCSNSKLWEEGSLDRLKDLKLELPLENPETASYEPVLSFGTQRRIPESFRASLYSKTQCEWVFWEIKCPKRCRRFTEQAWHRTGKSISCL